MMGPKMMDWSDHIVEDLNDRRRSGEIITDIACHHRINDCLAMKSTHHTKEWPLMNMLP